MGILVGVIFALAIAVVSVIAAIMRERSTTCPMKPGGLVLVDAVLGDS